MVEGVAQIRGGDFPTARAEAIRNALAEASRRSSLSVGATISIRDTSLAFDQTVVRSSASVHRHQIVSEGHDGEFYRVAISAELESSAGRSPSAVCRGGYVKRLLIGGFPLLRPEQLQSDELQGYAYLTAAEIARHFSADPAVFVDYDGSLMVHFGVPERVIGDMPKDDQALSLIRSEAEKHRAQYLLVGRFHSLALNNRNNREVDLEALVLDVFTGSCVARKRFSRTTSGHVVLPRSILFGSPDHYSTDFGRVYGELLSELASWAEATVSCQPFSARIIKVENGSVYFDAGAEQGVGIGDTFSAFKAKSGPVVTGGGEILGTEKMMAGTLRVTSVYPRFSIGWLDPTISGASPLELEPGDELYSQ